MVSLVTWIPGSSPRTNQHGMVIFPLMLSHPPTFSIFRNLLSQMCISQNATNLSSLNLSSLLESVNALEYFQGYSPVAWWITSFGLFWSRFLLASFDSPSDFVLLETVTNHSLPTFSMPLTILQFFIIQPSLSSFPGWRGFIYWFLQSSYGSHSIPFILLFEVTHFWTTLLKNDTLGLKKAERTFKVWINHIFV